MGNTAKAGRLVVNLEAGTAQFVLDMDKANKKLNEFGAHGVSSMQATSAALRTLEGNFTNNLRAAERFLATTLNLGGVLQKAFPIVGGIALLGVLTDLFKKAGEVHDALLKMEQAPQRIGSEFRQLNEPIAQSNAELAVTNDKLEMAIAKLEGKKSNGLKLALDEARLAANELATSLDKDLIEMNKLLQQESVPFWQRALGKASTDGVEKYFGGKDGNGGYKAKVDQLTDDQITRLAAATTEEQKHAIQVESAAKLDKLRGDALAYVNGELEKREKLQAITNATLAKGPTPTSPYGGGNAAVGAVYEDQDAAIEKLRGIRHNLIAEGQREALVNQHADLESKESTLRANKDKGEKEDPFGNKLRELQAQAEASKIADRVAGAASVSENAYAKAAVATTKVLAELNNELAKHHQHLSATQIAQIRSLEQTIALTNADAEWKNKLASTDNSITDRIRSQQLLTEAVGKGTAAIKAANVETQLMGILGEKYNDAPWMKEHAGQVTGLRSKLGNEYDAQKGYQSAEQTDQLNQQTAAENRLAAAQLKGAEAVHRQALENKILEMARNGASIAEQNAARAEDAAQQANKSAANLAGLREETEATERLTSAQLEGAEAVRQAALENKIAAATRAGATGQELQAMRQQAAAAHALQLATEAGQRINQASDRITSLRQQLDLIKQIQSTEGNTLQVRIAMKSTIDQLTQAENEQLLAVGTLGDGVKVFFREMAADGQSAAQQINDIMKSAFEGVNDNLAKLSSGQKASWASFFKDLSSQFAKMALEDGEKGLFKKYLTPANGQGQQGASQPWNEKAPSGIGGILAGLFGGGPGKRDGSSSSSALYVQIAGVGGTAGQFGSGPQLGGTANLSQDDLNNLGDFNPSELGQLAGSGGGDDGGGGGGFLGASVSILSKLFGGFRADGGDVDPGHAYMVGERGPEIWTPPSSGSIIPNNKLGGSTAYYTIDARGTDPVLTEQRTRAAILAAHNSAVTTAFQVTNEHVKRVPQR